MAIIIKTEAAKLSQKIYAAAACLYVCWCCGFVICLFFVKRQ